MHIPGGYHPDFSSSSSQSESYMQKSSVIRSTEGMKPRFRVAVFFVVKHEQGFIQEDLLGLYLRDSMFFTFPGIACVPVETFYFLKVTHFLYITIIYFRLSNCRFGKLFKGHHMCVFSAMVLALLAALRNATSALARSLS